MSFLSALQFLTIIPIKLNFNRRQIANSLIFFPVIGILLGLILWVVNYITNSALIVVIILIALTGGLHLDGLSDTFDALGSRKKNPLQIMRDSHIGAFGVIAITSVILLKIELINKVNPISLIIMPTLSRWCMVLSIYLFKYARTEGRAKIFFDLINSKIFIISSIITLFFSFIFFTMSGIWLILFCFIITYAINRYFSYRIGGITGDTIGALGEIIEVLVLCFMLISGKFGICPSYASTPQRLISIAPSITEEIFLLGAADNLVGVTTFCKYPDEARNKEKIGNIIELNIEKIVSLKPDIVLGTDINFQSKTDKLKELGIRVELLNEGKNFDEICKNFIKLGSLIGKKNRAVGIIKKLDKKIKITRRKTDYIPKILFIVGTEPLIVAGRDSFINDIIYYSGGENIVSEKIGYLRYSIESIISKDVDFVIIALAKDVAEIEKKKWQKYSNLSAVKNNKIFAVDPDLFSLAVPTRFITAVEELRKLINGK